MSMRRPELTERIADLEKALDRAELKLDQYKKADILQKLHISQLESIVLRVRNCVTPRVEWKISAEQEPIMEKGHGEAEGSVERN